MGYKHVLPHLGFPLFQCGRWTKTHQNEDHVFSNENAAVWLGPELGTKIKTTAEKLFGVFLSYQRDTNYISHSPPIFTKAALCTLGAQPFQSPRTPCLRTMVEKACTVFRTLRQ